MEDLTSVAPTEACLLIMRILNKENPPKSEIVHTP